MGTDEPRRDRPTVLTILTTENGWIVLPPRRGDDDGLSRARVFTTPGTLADWVGRWARGEGLGPVPDLIRDMDAAKRPGKGNPFAEAFAAAYHPPKPGDPFIPPPFPEQAKAVTAAARENIDRATAEEYARRHPHARETPWVGPPWTNDPPPAGLKTTPLKVMADVYRKAMESQDRAEEAGTPGNFDDVMRDVLRYGTRPAPTVSDPDAVPDPLREVLE